MYFGWGTALERAPNWCMKIGQAMLHDRTACQSGRLRKILLQYNIPSYKSLSFTALAEKRLGRPVPKAACVGFNALYIKYALYGGTVLLYCRMFNSLPTEFPVSSVLNIWHTLEKRFARNAHLFSASIYSVHQQVPILSFLIQFHLQMRYLLLQEHSTHPHHHLKVLVYIVV